MGIEANAAANQRTDAAKRVYILWSSNPPLRIPNLLQHALLVSKNTEDMYAHQEYIKYFCWRSLWATKREENNFPVLLLTLRLPLQSRNKSAITWHGTALWTSTTFHRASALVPGTEWTVSHVTTNKELLSKTASCMTLTRCQRWVVLCWTQHDSQSL